MNDIINKEDINLLVEEFYKHIQNDKLIGPIFTNKIPINAWPQHLERMSSFWYTVLFGQADYRGNPFSHHTNLGLDTLHFDRWIYLFRQTINNNFKGPKAEEALDRAHKMRAMFESKLAYLKANPNKRSIV